MHRRSALLGALLTLGCALASDRADARGDEQAASAVPYEGKLIHLDETGHFHVWNLEDGRFDPEMSAKLAHDSITHLATDGGRLWASGKSVLYDWSSKEQAWKKVADFDGGGEALLALAGLDGSPLLIFPSKVMDLKKVRTFKVPMMRGQIQTDSLRLLAFRAADSMLWLGTGHGEWGGHLVGLNPKTGQWVQYYDDLHYVTGITTAGPGEVIVSWSMSHFNAHTRIRIHGLDGKPKTAYPMLYSKYYQTISYNKYDKLLYGVENTHLVTIKDGKPSKVAELQGQVFEREPRAIGVAPGVSALIPVAEKALIVVPNHGLPWRLKDGELTQLRTP